MPGSSQKKLLDFPDSVDFVEIPSALIGCQ